MRPWRLGDGVASRELDNGPLRAEILGPGDTELGAGQEIQILDGGELLVGSGNANPLREIFGAATQLTFSLGVASSRAKDCAWAKSVDGCLDRDYFEGGSLCDGSATTGARPCP